MKHIVILSGAGVSAESGIQTFRDSDGLWEGHSVEDVATPMGFMKDPQLVLDFYNQRRAQLKTVEPNEAHKLIAKLEEHFKVTVITQNVDDLHERAGSTNVIHLHGELKKVRSTKYEEFIYNCEDDINIGDLCEKGAQLRPHIVWFTEAVPMIEKACTILPDCDIVIVIGTSMQVYPAASLIGYAPPFCESYYIDPAPKDSYEIKMRRNHRTIAMKATEGMKMLYEELVG
jgi:NAD-dependent deacetylase